MTQILAGQEGVRTLTFPATVREVNTGAFSNLESLISIIMNEGLDMLEECSFFSARLRKTHVPTTLREIGESAFTYCRNLKSFVCPENSNLKEIGKDCFQYSGLEEAVL